MPVPLAVKSCFLSCLKVARTGVKHSSGSVLPVHTGSLAPNALKCAMAVFTSCHAWVTMDPTWGGEGPVTSRQTRLAGQTGIVL